MEKHKVHIEKIVNGGAGLARLPSGQVLFVEAALPNEDIIVTVRQKKKNYSLAFTEKIETSHQGRILPPCKYYDHCGGCNLQHCNYPGQLEIKRSILADMFARENNQVLKKFTNKIAPVIASPEEFHYRQRIRLQVRDSRLGFNQKKSHDIVEVDSCMLAGARLNESLAEIRDNNAANHLLCLASEVELLTDPASELTTLIFHYPRKTRPADHKAAVELCNSTRSVERVLIAGEGFPVAGPFYGAKSIRTDNSLSIRYNVNFPNSPKPLAINLGWEAGGFCQLNLAQNRMMIETVLNLLEPDTNDTILDLFCGMGNFSIPLALRVKEITGIEGQGSAIRSAKKNSTANNCLNTSFSKSSVEKACSNLLERHQQFSKILIDPPRHGAPEIATQLFQLTTDRMVYVSCDPATLCRDLANLLRAGFTIQTILPIDMFPQTSHIETIVLLKK